MSVTLYDFNRKRIAVLKNATNVSANETLNSPQQSTASFQLPFDDPKLDECTFNRLIRIQHKNEDYGLFAIDSRNLEHNARGMVTIQCKHVACLLLNNIMPGYHEQGGSTFKTRDVLQYILNFQSTKDWVLGACDFDFEYQYGWEQARLLEALLDVPNLFVDQHRFEFDTKNYPWTINLRKIDETITPASRFIYKKNIQTIRRQEDPSSLCNKLYCLGYGEGINQLSIESANNGKRYIEDTASQAKYGLIEDVFVDREFENAESLLARGKEILSAYNKPKITYTVDIVDMSPKSTNTLDKPVVGTMTRVIDKLIKEDFKALIVAVKRSNIFGATPSTQVEISNTPANLAKIIADQANKQFNEQIYAQGATNIWAQTFAENASPSKPIIIELFIPEYTKVVNRVNFRWRAEAFRADVSAVANNQSEVETTSSFPQTNETSEAGGGANSSTGAGGGDYGTSGPSSISSTGGGIGTTFYEPITTGDVNYGTPSTYAHSHGIQQLLDFSKNLTSIHTHNIQHNHTLNIPEHTHTFSVPTHTHVVTLPRHDHTIVIPAHSHAMRYDIYEGTTASSATVRIGSKKFTVPQNTDFDIVDYLEKDAQGLIKRGTSHIIYLTPNALTRLAGTVTPQVFIQSRGGGNY